MNVTWILNPGHGGIDSKGRYTTAKNYDVSKKGTWRKMWVHDGEPIFEGVINREIVEKIAEECEKEGLIYCIQNAGYEDVPLSTRVRVVNNFHDSLDRQKMICVYFSQHGNASGKGTAHGLEVFTSPGKTLSDGFASIIAQEVVNAFPEERFRADYSDGDIDKEARFTELVDTHCPALLFEFMFFDNPEQAKKMSDPDVQRRYAKAVVQGFKKAEIWIAEKLVNKTE